MVLSYISPVPTLPRYPGPLAVGSAEFEIPVSEIPSPSPVPDPSISTVKFRIFYPTSTTNEHKVQWLPQPQNQWLEAYATFLGASSRMAKIFSFSPNPLKHTTIPASSDVPVLAPSSKGGYPVVIFSHGLGGSCNVYSSILGALASCGVICIAPEHRDQSCPTSVIRHPDGKGTTRVSYLHSSHNPTLETLAARNGQLRIRLWELELVYSAVEKLNSGLSLTNLANQKNLSFKHTLDLTPGNITWAGHSFGAASIVQLVKSVFWHQSLPKLPAERQNDPDWRPLYTPAENSALSTQITAHSPVVLLDLWTMPLRSEFTQSLWEKPLPCWAAETTTSCNVIAIMSEEFYNWTDLLQRTKSLLSRTPASGPPPTDTGDKQSPRLFYAPKTAHLSQSDFGCLFPWVTKYFMKAEQPERTILLNVRAFLQLFRERGVHVEGFREDVLELEGGEDRGILAHDGEVEGWTPLPLSD